MGNRHLEHFLILEAEGVLLSPLRTDPSPSSWSLAMLCAVGVVLDCWPFSQVSAWSGSQVLWGLCWCLVDSYGQNLLGHNSVPEEPVAGFRQLRQSGSDLLLGPHTTGDSSKMVNPAKWLILDAL